MNGTPDHACHYWRRSRSPFLNLSDLSAADLRPVLEGLRHERRAGEHRRAFGGRYMALRARTETKLRRLFVEAGGKPERQIPHYFVLGESRWFQGLADDTEVIRFLLRDLPDEVTSFTYPDSFTAMGLAGDYGLPTEERPYHRQVFRLSELDPIISSYGLPPDTPGGYSGYERRPLEAYVEIQLWSDPPVARWLAPST